MKQSEFETRVYQLSGLAREQVASVFDVMAGLIADQLSLGDSIVIGGVGKFTVTDRAAHAGLNPRTGEAIAVPARRTVRFRPAKVLRDALNPPAPAWHVLRMVESTKRRA